MSFFLIFVLKKGIHLSSREFKPIFNESFLRQANFKYNYAIQFFRHILVVIWNRQCLVLQSLCSVLWSWMYNIMSFDLDLYQCRLMRMEYLICQIPEDNSFDSRLNKIQYYTKNKTLLWIQKINLSMSIFRFLKNSLKLN